MPGPYWLKVYDIPEGARSSKGRAIQNVIQIEPDDKVRAYLNVRRLDDADYVANNYIILCTKDGTIKKTRLEAYSRPRQNGVNAIVIREDRKSTRLNSSHSSQSRMPSSA